MQYSAEELMGMSDEELTNNYLRGILNTKKIQAARDQAQSARMGVGLGEAAREAAAAIAGTQYKPRGPQAMAGIGAGVKAAEADRSAQLGAMSEVMKQKARMADAASKRKAAGQVSVEEARKLREQDPNSQDSLNMITSSVALSKKIPSINPEMIKGKSAYQLRMEGLDPKSLMAMEKSEREFNRKVTLENKKEERFQNSLEVPGIGKARDPMLAKEARKAVPRYEALMGNFKEAAKLRKKHGGQFFRTKEGAIAQGLMTDVVMDMKELLNLGVLNGPDIDILEDMIPRDPLAFDQWAKDYLPKWLRGQTETKLMTLQKTVNRRMGSQLAGAGFDQKTVNSYLGRHSLPGDYFSEEQTFSGTAIADDKVPIKKEFSPSRNQYRITYSDGSTEVVDADK